MDSYVVGPQLSLFNLKKDNGRERKNEPAVVAVLHTFASTISQEKKDKKTVRNRPEYFKRIRQVSWHLSFRFFKLQITLTPPQKSLRLLKPFLVFSSSGDADVTVQAFVVSIHVPLENFNRIFERVLDMQGPLLESERAFHLTFGYNFENHSDDFFFEKTTGLCRPNPIFSKNKTGWAGSTRIVQ